MPSLGAGKYLAFLYDPDKMPADLLAAHRALYRAVDACYGVEQPFASEVKRVANLVGLYERLVGKATRSNKLK